MQTRHPLTRRLGGRQSRAGHLGEEESLVPVEIQTPYRSVLGLFSTLPVLTQLLD